MGLLEIRRGRSRLVVLIGPLAIKVPHIRKGSVLPFWGQVRQGRNCNKAERAAHVEQDFPNLCPILWADRFGWLVVMVRAERMTTDEFDAWESSEEWPHLPAMQMPYELKAEDAGRLPDGRRVMVDYGAAGYD